MLLKNATYLNRDYKFVHGDILIENGRINLEDTSATGDALDCSDYWIIPGLFNAHYHGYSLLAKGLARDMKIEDWNNDSHQGNIQKKFFENLDQLTAEEYQIICMKSYLEMVKCGITFVSESEPGYWPNVVAEGIAKVGLRGLVDTYQQIVDFVHKQVDEVSFGTHLLEEEDITDETLESCVLAKKQHDALFLTHCMENDWRKDLVYSKYGKSSVTLYEERGLLDDKTILFHGVHLNEKDIQLIEKEGASVVHCPVSNLWTGAGSIAPVGTMLEKGVNVCLGTDFANTNLWETMKIAYFLLKLNHPVQRFTAEDVLKMASKNGANAYKFEDLGSIQENYKADLVFIKKDKFVPNVDSEQFSTVVHNLIMEARGDSVHHVMIDGEWVMLDRKLVTVDEDEINSKYITLMNRIYETIK